MEREQFNPNFKMKTKEIGNIGDNEDLGEANRWQYMLLWLNKMERQIAQKALDIEKRQKAALQWVEKAQKFSKCSICCRVLYKIDTCQKLVAKWRITFLVELVTF